MKSNLILVAIHGLHFFNNIYKKKHGHIQHFLTTDQIISQSIGSHSELVDGELQAKQTTLVCLAGCKLIHHLLLCCIS